MLGILPMFDGRLPPSRLLTADGVDGPPGTPSRGTFRLGSVNAEHRTVELTGAGVRDLTAEVISAAGRGSTPFGSYLFSASDPAAELARYVERDVFGEAFACSPEVVAAAYDHYEPASVFLCVLDHRRCLPVGSIRVVVPSPLGFKSLDEIGRHWHQSPADVLTRTPVTIDLGRTWDIATLMVCPGYRTGTVSQALHQAVCTASHHAGVAGFVTILDVAVLRLLQFQLRRVFQAYDGVEAKYYEGSPSQPVWCDLPAYRARLRSTHRDLYETLFEGQNLGPAVSTPDWHAELDRIAVARYDTMTTSTSTGRVPLLTGGVGT